jgi:hypothetical protein
VTTCLPWGFVEKVRKTFEAVIPVQAGIQHINDFIAFNYLDPAFAGVTKCFSTTP